MCGALRTLSGEAELAKMEVGRVRDERGWLERCPPGRWGGAPGSSRCLRWNQAGICVGVLLKLHSGEQGKRGIKEFCALMRAWNPSYRGG